MRVFLCCFLISVGYCLTAQPVSRLPTVLENSIFHEPIPPYLGWVEHGIPLPPGVIHASTALQLQLDHSQVPADFQPLAWWPDGSLRWCLLRAPWTPSASYVLDVGGDTENDPDALFHIRFEGSDAMVETGVIQVRLNAERAGVLHDITMSSRSNGVYDVKVLQSHDDQLRPITGRFDLVHDGHLSKQLHFSQSYPNGTIGVEWWLTCYQKSGHLSLEYTIRNGKSASSTMVKDEGALHWMFDSSFARSGMFHDGESVVDTMRWYSDGSRLDMLGAVGIGDSHGAFLAMIRRFGSMHPRGMERTDSGGLSLSLVNGELRPFTAYGVEIEVEITPESITPELLQNWAMFYEFPPMLLPSLDWIQGTGAWDGGFLGDVRPLSDRTEANSELRDHWSDDYTFAPRSPGWLHYGESTMPVEGNAHGPGAQMSGAFDRFIVQRTRDRFMEAEELAIGLMESRGIALDDVELTPSSGYATYNHWFDYPADRLEGEYPANGWSDPVEGRMWDAGHRGFYPLTEFYYLTGSQRAAKAFHQLTLGSRYINLREPSLALSSRTAAYFWTQYARHYSIFRDPVDLQMIKDNWNRTRTAQVVTGNNAFQSMHPSGIIVDFAPYEDDTGFAPGGQVTKLIFQNVLMQSYYDVYQLAGLEQARDLLYSSGQWQMRIYRQLGFFDPPNYAYRPWLEESPQGSNAAGGSYFWGAQNFPGMALYYHLFGDYQARQILDRANQVYWTGQTAGFAGAIAFATNQTKPDHQSPPPIAELYFEAIHDQLVRLTWRNVEDAKIIQIKSTRQPGPIKDRHQFEDRTGVAWWEMVSISGEPPPGIPGSLQSMDISVEEPPASYRFAIKTQDVWGNISPLSIEGRILGSVPAPAVAAPNYPPVAIADGLRTILLEEDQSTIALDLNAGASFDPEGELLLYEWTGSPDPDDQEIATVLLGPGNYAFQLRVSDPAHQWSLPAMANVRVISENNQEPIDPEEPPDPTDPPDGAQSDVLPAPPVLTQAEMTLKAAPSSQAPWRDALITALQEPNANLGGSPLADLYSADGGGQQRLLIWFPLPQLTEGWMLKSAILNLHQEMVLGEPPLPMVLRIHPLLESWTEGLGEDPWAAGSAVSWRQRNNGVAWMREGGTFDTNHWVGAELPAENNQSVDIDITALLERWYEGEPENNGLILVPQQSHWVVHRLHTRESDESHLRPSLQLKYQQAPIILNDYEQWVEFWNVFFSTLPSNQQLPGADPDGDQRVNWLEFAMDGHPGRAEEMPGMRASLVEGELVFEIPVIRDSNLLNWSIESSPDFIQWTDVTHELNSEALNHDWPFRWTEPVGDRERFFRLSINFSGN